MLQPLSHKENKTAWANDAKIALFFCDLNHLIAIGHVLQNPSGKGVYDNAPVAGMKTFYSLMHPYSAMAFDVII